MEIPIYYFDRITSQEDGEPEMTLTIRKGDTIVYGVKVLDGPGAKERLLGLAEKAGHVHIRRTTSLH